MAEVTIVADRSGDLRLSAAEKEQQYVAILDLLEAALEPEHDLLSCMATVACLLHQGMPYFFWTGFYRRVGPQELRVGPYQGTMGCFSITFDRGVCGVCGACAREERTIIVPDVDAFPGHIACDSASRSEIVVPVFDQADRLIAVFDVDSTLPAAFDEVDQRYLERAVALLRDKEPVPVVV